MDNTLDCPICLCPVEGDDYYMFKSEKCGHCLHLECIKPYFKNEVDDGKFPLHCPVPTCKECITTDEL